MIWTSVESTSLLALQRHCLEKKIYLWWCAYWKKKEIYRCRTLHSLWPFSLFHNYFVSISKQWCNMVQKYNVNLS